MAPSLYEGRHRAEKSDTSTEEVGRLTQQLAVTDELPRMVAKEMNPERLGAAKAFFSRRIAQLSSVSARSRRAFDQLFGAEVTSSGAFGEIGSGIRLTGGQALRARLHPHQLKRNAINNTRMFRDLPLIPSHESAISNPVVRKSLYKKAIQGDSAAVEYLKQHDRKLGKTDQNAKEAAVEAFALLSGAAAVRKVGLYALMGVTVGEALFVARNPDKRRKLLARFEKLEQKNNESFGSVGYLERQQAYAKIAQRDSTTPRRDPFEHIH